MLKNHGVFFHNVIILCCGTIICTTVCTWTSNWNNVERKRLHSFSDDDFSDPDIVFDSDCKDNSESDCDEMERMYF